MKAVQDPFVVKSHKGDVFCYQQFGWLGGLRAGESVVSDLSKDPSERRRSMRQILYLVESSHWHRLPLPTEPLDQPLHVVVGGVELPHVLHIGGEPDRSHGLIQPA